MLKRFKYLVTHGHTIRELVPYNAKGLARILGANRKVSKDMKLIPSLSFLAPGFNSDGYTKNFEMLKVRITHEDLGFPKWLESDS